MKSRLWTSNPLVPFYMALTLTVVSGCDGDKSELNPDTSVSSDLVDSDSAVDGGSSDLIDTGSSDLVMSDIAIDRGNDGGAGDLADSADTGVPEEVIGNPIGEPVPIDHAAVVRIVESNLTHHIDGFDESLSFLEDSVPAQNLYDMLFGEEEDEDPVEPGEGEEPGDEVLEFDFSGLRDGMVDVMLDRILVEEISMVADDGLSISYQLSAEYFCAEEPEEEESSEDEAERIENEAECGERLSSNPVRFSAMSDGEEDINLTIWVGEEEVDPLFLQLHDDLIAMVIDFAKIKPFVEVFIDPDDFDLPETMEGSIGGEIREEAPLKYGARFAMPTAIHVVPADDQEPFGLDIPAANTPGHITIDGTASTLSGALEMGSIDASIPWQIIVDMFYDDEGHSEWICPDEASPDDCYEEWIEAPEPPEVDEGMIASLSGVSGSLAYSPEDDIFRFSGMSLGDSTTVLSVDTDTIVSFDLNPDDGRTMDLSISSNEADGIGFSFTPSLDVQIIFAWHQVSDVFEDLATFLMDETIGVQMGGSDAPTLDILRGEETRFRVTSGQLTFWSTEMDEDVVIEEGECITGSDDEDEDQHDLFGGLMGDTCES